MDDGPNFTIVGTVFSVVGTVFSVVGTLVGPPLAGIPRF